jgi:midasin
MCCSNSNIVDVDCGAVSSPPALVKLRTSHARKRRLSRRDELFSGEFQHRQALLAALFSTIMDCVWDNGLLRRGDQLPADLLETIQNGDDKRYLEAMTKAALDPRYTYILFAHCGDLFAHVCASLRSYASLPSTVATLGRILPYAPYLSSYATQLLAFERDSLVKANDETGMQISLLGLLRLLRCDHRLFGDLIDAPELMSLLGRSSPAVTYLVIRILQIKLQAADHWFESTLKQYVGEDISGKPIDGQWDEKTVDLRFLSLWEEDRYEDVQKLLSEFRQPRTAISSSHVRRITPESFHPSTALVGGVLLPRLASTVALDQCNDPLIQTPTISQNLENIAHALKRPHPLLLSGLAGSGKTLLIRHVAQSLGKLDKMVTLHLNEQSDAKLLLGLYTTGDVPGTFVWRPGVLTTAVLEGRWVLIEDLDRAPNEVLGTLLPLIEKRELLISNRKDVINAAEGFRIVATVRTSVNHRGEETKPLLHMLGSRHWQSVSITMPPAEEQAMIVQRIFPDLERLVPQFMAVYEHLLVAKQHSSLLGQSKTGVARSISPRDLLKWCRRVSALLKDRPTYTSSDDDSVFLEAIDCFMGALPDDAVRASLAAVTAQELRIDPQRRDYLLSTREVQYKAEKDKIVIGRYMLPRPRQIKVVNDSFSTNPHTIRMLERVVAAVLNREPLLLVGETGVGKTTSIQHLATHLGKKLVPFNLSQQSEAGDLLGGFKPVNARTLMVPMKDEFDDLFTESFSAGKNRQFTELLGKQMARSNWKAVCKLFRQALVMVEQQREMSPSREGEAPAKKRKTDSKRAIDFAKWDTFASKVASLEAKLAGGGDTVAFTFLEGNIVKAVRNGDWILLDEINLASSDTLESIADLLDSSPSLLLTEAGNIERIRAHPEFRVFAAMNPATDVGKKDLPPGVRSRFTELYVDSPDRDLKSLQSIVRAYLRQETTADPAIAVDVSILYQKIIALSQDNKLVDGAGQKPHFSLRTLTRTLTYAKHIQQMCSIRRALYEGFQMSFLTFLDLESAALVQPLIEQHLLGKRTNKAAELRKALRKPDDGQQYVQGYPGSKHWIRQGREQLQDQPHYIITPFVRRNLENLVRAASTRQFPVLIQGPTSAGKTSMIEYLAKRTGHKFTRINNHEHTDLQEYLGTYVSGTDGRLHFEEGVLVKALREGHWIVLDELNLAPTDVLEALNRLLDDNRELLVPETQEVIRPHSDFMLFATQNPAGLYGGRKTLSRAFRNRFLELHFDDIPVNELQDILHQRTQLPESRCKRVVAVYKELSVLRQENRLFEQKSFATLRDLFRWALRPNDTIEQLAANGYMLLCERVRKPEERIALKAIIEKAMSEKGPKVRIDEDALYSTETPEISQHNDNASDHGVVWTKAMRRLYVLVCRAIANDEPVLLVGETGCGKTTVCQMLADALKKTLHMVNAHQNTETGDLIGSQRPVRNRAAIEASLRDQLLASLALQPVNRAKEQPTDALLSEYDRYIARLDKVEKSAYTQTSTHLQIQSTRTRFKALFEWADGSLVQAMRAGELFLLDEISLADDSVLERINSVLEPSRTILLAEKGSLDSSVTAATGFQFFATMNPGGDYGKRELSPALRNRFTEIWVPAMSDLDDVLQIVRSKLLPEAQPASDAMIGFASWFKQKFDTSASSSISIRDTLAWVQFVNGFAGQSVLPAIVHGAAMVYIDTLGANPAGLMTCVSTNLEAEREACLEELVRLYGPEARTIYHEVLEVHSSPTSFGISPFTIPKAPETPLTGDAFSFDPPTTKLNAMRVLRALQLQKPVMLEGSPGVGKTALVTAIAAAVGVPLTRINLSDQTDLLDLFGSDAPVEGAQTGTFVWRDAPFLRAMKKGEWVLLDEMNLASQSVLEGLNACLDHRGEVFIPELGQSFTRHPDFRLFAAQNPHHQGGGRKGLPASFVNRFTVVYADSFRAEDLMLICRRTFPSIDPDHIKRAVAFVSRLNDEVANQHNFGASGGPWEFNLRDISRWLCLASSDEGLLRAGTPKDFVEMLFTQRFRSSTDQACVRQLFAVVFPGSQPMSDLFCNVSTRTLQIGISVLPRNALTALPAPQMHRGMKANLRAAQSAMLCIHRAWPVILTGAPGAGKSSLIEHLGSLVGAEIVTLGMSAETDALDLIGGYEQSDPYRQTAQALSALQDLRDSSCKLVLAQGCSGEATELRNAFDHAMREYDDANISRLLNLAPEVAKSDIQSLLDHLRHQPETINKARFEWIDGPLIEALEHGKWLVLDNANLCSSSVLDRLNGLLEPNGVLIVNEHTKPDGSAHVIKPHPAFRIFLSVDPRFGELSRAMRNRAVEIFLTCSGPSDAASTVNFHAESAMSRFQAISVVNAPGASDAHLEQVYNIAGDHLALVDQVLLSRFKGQLSSGLYASRLGNTAFLLDDSPKNIAGDSQLQSLYQGCSSVLQAPADFACVQVSIHVSTPRTVSIAADGKCFSQTLHPLNNQPLVQQTERSFSIALSLAARHDINISFNELAKALTIVKSDRKLVDRLARFWKTAREQMDISGRKNKASLLDVLEKLMLSIHDWLRQDDVIPREYVQSVQHVFNRLLSFCWTLLRNMSSDHLDLPLFTATVLVGQTSCTKRVSGLPTLDHALDQFQTRLSSIGLAIDTEARHAFVAAWKALRPTMPRNMGKLQALLKFETVLNKFDQATFHFQLPVKQIVDLRMAFQMSLDLDPEAENLEVLAERSWAQIPDVNINSEAVDNAVEVSPHFRSTFELLCQHLAMNSRACHDPVLSTTIETLAVRKSLDGLQCSRGLDRESACLALRRLGLSLPMNIEVSAYDHAAISNSIIRDLKTITNVSLAGLGLLGTELNALGRTVAGNMLSISTSSFQTSHDTMRNIARAVLEGMTAAEPGILKSHCQRLLKVVQVSGAVLEPENLDSIEVPNDGNKLTQSICRRLNFVARFLRYDPNSPDAPHGWTTRKFTAAAYIALATACLNVLIPEHPFDPVQESQAHVSVHVRHKETLLSRLLALREFREACVGEPDSVRARLLEEALSDLGPSPTEFEICRPQQSQLPQLHGELQALKRIIAPLCEITDELSHLDAGARSNMQVLRTRLAEQYRPYADLTAPVVGLIDLLAIAHQLVSMENTAVPENTARLSTIAPLVDATARTWLSDDHFISMQKACRTKEEQMFWLSAVAARSAAMPLSRASAELRSAIDSAFGLFYEAWRTELNRDQKLASANSSLYQYRGVDDESEEATAEQLNALFPDYDDGPQTEKHASTIDAQSLAPNMAQVHHVIYAATASGPELILDLLQQIPQVPSVVQGSSMVAILCALHKLSTSLTAAPKSKNIYTEADIGQSKTLIALIGRVQSRFATIHKAWPEHAVPIDVLRLCNQVLALGHAEPVARYLQPVEKLHAAINEWQKVASSQYSAANQLEEMTSLIISWRQLELSTWAGLFEQENKACKRNAASWWYIAYETIVRATEDEAQHSGELQSFAAQLVETLGSFLANCGLGEYGIRLAMLQDFETDLATRTSDRPALAIVRQALASLITFYAHFKETVGEHLAKKRSELEKQVREVVQLASWKDRNIETMRQSAKASHRKLFRLVKKYRVLLSEPVAPLLQSDFPNKQNSGQSDVPVPTGVLEQDTQNIDTPTLQAWEARPKSLRDIPATIEQIQAKTKSVQALSDGTKRIDKFLADLNEESSELQKATPSTATEQNKTLVQHLKTRKRRLLADVLRDVRLMGFQSNLSDDVLVQQQSFHAVLSKSPPLLLHGGLRHIHAAEYEFHKLLHIMPSVRESAVKHNEDLTPAEITRSKMLLESMLQTSIEQHSRIAQDLSRYATLRTQISQLVALASAKDAHVLPGMHSPHELNASMCSLSAVLEATAKCVNMHGDLAGTEYAQVLDALKLLLDELALIKEQSNLCDNLPVNVTTSTSRDVDMRYTNVVENLHAHVNEYSQRFPELSHILGKLRDWASVHGGAEQVKGSSPIEKNDWVRGLLTTVEECRAHIVKEAAPVGKQHLKRAWLFNQQADMREVVTGFGVDKILGDLEVLLSQVPSIRGDDLSSQSTDIRQVSVACHAVQPLLVAYADSVETVLSELCNLHIATSKMAYRLSTSFIQLARQGFCTPSEKAQGEEKDSGDVESGTGLGDGEGAEDISKDVGADEDLSELAQDATSKNKDGETEAEKDAVDMADEDLEGEFDEDDGSDGEEDGQEKDDAEDADLDEETGHVGEDDSAVDEKTWDDGKKADEAEKEADKGKGTKNDDQSAAADNAESEDQDQETQQDTEDAAEMDENEADGEFNEPDKADPHMQEQQNLDLPEDLQMDGDEKSLSDVSDMEDDFPEEMDDLPSEDDEPGKAELKDPDVEMGDSEGDDQDENTGEATGAEDEEQQAEEPGDDAKSDIAMLENEDAPSKPDDGLNSADAGQGQEEDENSAQKTGATSSGLQQDDQEANQPSEQTGATEGTQRNQTNDATGQAESGEEQQSLPFKQLGDVLKQWYNQHRNIESVQENDQEQEQKSNEEADMTDPRFEHLPEDADTEMQALGAANVEQSKALDEQNAIDANDSAPDTLPLPQDSEQQQPEDVQEQDAEDGGADVEGIDGAPRSNETMVGKTKDVDMPMQDAQEEEEMDDFEDMDEKLTNTHLSQELPDFMSIEHAREAWSEHESRTRNMAIVLTEHLRLILQPTQATKMRGDFRTGKRLNIKKIIPYIASSYKRDKIWMRRSIPSKRSYQIMLAIDDSESMNENERKGLAFDTLALVAKSMSMLEVGELSIVGFGQNTNVAHEFSTPFTSDAGAEVFRQFTFAQTKTDVRKLLEKSIEMFRTARMKATGAASNLWQLQLIISDGLCEDHPSVRQLVRQAHDEQIMIVFIVVDATAPATTASGGGASKQSILDLNRVEFTQDAGGEPQMNIVKYLDTFPFRYYLIVRDVLELPHVLAGALRQWFAEVVDSDG